VVQNPPITASGSLSNHVSENFLAFARVGKWAFGCASILTPDDYLYSDPNIPPEDYKIGQIRRWFKERDIRVESHLDHAQLKANFLSIMATPGGPPAIPEKGEAGISEEVIHDLIESSVSMVAHVMVEGEVSEEQCLSVERHVKIFLGAFERFDKPRRDVKDALISSRQKKKVKATWITKMNFVSLLNLPNVMRRFGSLRAMWEGDRKCEGGLPKIKAKVRGGTKGNWSRAAARSLTCDTAIERVIKSAADAAGDDARDHSVTQLVEAAREITGEGTDSKFKNFVRYKNSESANMALLSGSPVSMVMLEDGSCGFMLKNTLSFIPVRLDREVPDKLICGAAYMNFKTGEAHELIIPHSVRNQTIEKQQNHLAAKYVLLLPEISITANVNGPVLYYLITSDWEEMNAEGDVVRYQVSKAHYQ
jgi:hypothetical protein